MRRDRTLGLLLLFHVGFWIGFERLRQALFAVVGEHGSSLGLLELVIITLVPLASGLWAVLERYKLEPSTAAKLSLGFVLMAVSWFCLGVGLEWSAQPGGGGVASCVALLIAAALCVGPASLRVVFELGGRPRAWLGAWVLGYVLARVLGSWGAASIGVESCASVGLACVAAGVGLAFAWRPIASLAGEVRPGNVADLLEPSDVAARQRAQPSGV